MLFVIGVMISSRFQATGGDSGTCSSWYFTHGMYCNGDEVTKRTRECSDLQDSFGNCMCSLDGTSC